MAKNFIQPGKVLTLTAPADVDSGGVVHVGGLIGIAMADAETGADVETALEGVFTLPKVSGQTITQGTKLFWLASPGAAETSGSIVIGHAAAGASSGALTVQVRLIGVGA